MCNLSCKSGQTLSNWSTNPERSTDRKLTYWEVLDGSLVRELEGSPSGAINTLDLSYEGSLFVTGGNDQVVKLWKYQEGITTHIGLGHSAVITTISFSPNGKYIVSEKEEEKEDEKKGEEDVQEENGDALSDKKEQERKLKKCYGPFRMTVRRPAGRKC